jgi:DNA-directed RNA polymerase I, II, and III subunit RPABC5
MIIPIRCVSCNNVLAGKWLPYTKIIEEERKKDGRTDTELQYLTQETKKSAEGRALDQLGLLKQCCRRHMLTHIDLI